ncbi:MAG: hypothetical protein ACI4F4_08275 [Lachnospiraceae bacterium]
MLSKEELLKDDMHFEAMERLKLLQVSLPHRNFYFINRICVKAIVDHQEKKITVEEPSEKELKMIKEMEKQKQIMIYYMIQDEGLWPDGATFPRYTFLHVDSFKEEYEYVKEECIVNCHTVPAYVVNMEEPDNPELTEVLIGNIDGVLIQTS